MKCNECLRKTVKKSGVPYWKIALRLGMSEGTLCRHLRVELDEEERRRVLQALNEIIEDEREGK